MADAPLVSIIIPTFNYSSVLRHAISTVLWQTFQDFELLVIGDGCTDDSETVAKSFGDPRIHWLNLPQNTGSQSVPNNTGLRLARGQFIAYLGHDDVWLPRHLEFLVPALQDCGADLAYSICAMLGPPERDKSGLTGISPSGQYEYNLFVPPSSLLHRANVVKDIGEWRDYRTIPNPPDVEFLTRALEYGKRFLPVPELTVFKFPSNMRRNCYRDRPSHEQADCIRRIKTEPDFIYRELLRVYARQVKHHPQIALWGLKPKEGVKDHGTIVEEWLKFRGLK